MRTAIDIPQISAVESAKALRAALRTAFPTTRFAVRKRARSTTVTVSWTDGPETASVVAVVEPFQGTTFDGRDDSTVRLSAQIEWQGVTCRSGIGYLFTQRDISSTTMGAAIDLFRNRGWSGSDLDLRCAARQLMEGVEFTQAAADQRLRYDAARDCRRGIR